MVQCEPDMVAAYRWNVLNEIRRKDFVVRYKIIQFLRRSGAKKTAGEELGCLAKDRGDWGRFVRERRTEGGWPIGTRYTRSPDLDIGAYGIEENREAQEHDRRIKDEVGVKVLERDGRWTMTVQPTTTPH